MRSDILNRWDALKAIAILLMFFDHAGAFFFEEYQWMRGVGRACAPIFLFLVGFAGHYRFDKKLLLLAILLTLNDWLVIGHANTLNILWTILIIRMIFAWMEHRGKTKLRLHEWVIGAVPLIPLVLLVQYGSLGFLIALCGYVYKHRNQYEIATPRRFFIFTLVFYGAAVAYLSGFSLLTTLVTALSLAAFYHLIQWFLKSPTEPLALSAPLTQATALASHHSAVIYVVHLMILGWMTGKAI